LRVTLALAAWLPVLLLAEIERAHATPTAGQLAPSAFDCGTVQAGDGVGQISDMVAIIGGSDTTGAFATRAFSRPGSRFGGGDQSATVANDSAREPACSASFVRLVTGGTTPLNVLVTDVEDSQTAGAPISLTGTTGNRNRLITGGNSVFVGTAPLFSLNDNSQSRLSTSSQSFGFKFQPMVPGTQETAIPPAFSYAETRDNVGGSMTPTLTATATTSIAGTTLGYTYTPICRGITVSAVSIAFSSGNNNSTVGQKLSQSVARIPTGTAVGPVYFILINGAVSTNTPTAVADGTAGAAASSTNSLGTLSYANSPSYYQMPRNTTTDTNGGNATSNEVSIEKYFISHGNPGTAGSTITEADTLLVPLPIMVSNSANGALNSSLAIFVDQSLGLGGFPGTYLPMP
jgi:hypothetical protein